MAGIGIAVRFSGWEGLLNAFPGFAGLDRLSRMLLYSRSMELQLNCGIPLEVALLEGERLFSSSHQKNLKKVRSQIASGVSIQEAFSRHSGFPAHFLRQLNISQSSRDLAAGFERNAHYFEELLNRRKARLNAFIEPAFMMFLGLGVLIFLLMLYLPLFELGAWL